MFIQRIDCLFRKSVAKTTDTADVRVCARGDTSGHVRAVHDSACRVLYARSGGIFMDGSLPKYDKPQLNGVQDYNSLFFSVCII